jgi:hypothetical protein
MISRFLHLGESPPSSSHRSSLTTVRRYKAVLSKRRRHWVDPPADQVRSLSLLASSSF